MLRRAAGVRAPRPRIDGDHAELASDAGSDGPGAAALPAGRFSLLAEREFRKLWLVGAIISTVRWLELLAVGVVVFDLTGSPAQVALLIILRMLPLALFGAFAGAMAEWANHKRILVAGLGVLAATSLALALLAATGRIEVWHIAVGAVLNGMFWLTDFPVRRTWLGELAGSPRVGAAMSLDTLTNNGTRMLGPTLGGLLLEVLGLDGTFLLAFALYVAALALLAGLHGARRGTAAGGSVLARVAEGLRHVRGDATLVGLLAITVIFNLWGFPVISMIPVIGKDVLGLSAFPVGLLMGCEGAGALIGSLAIVVLGRARLYRRIYVSGLTLYLATALAFSHSPVAALSGVLLFAAGLGAAGFSAMQATLVFLNSPAAVRSRVMGVLAVCIGTAPLGFLHVGLLADLLGAPLAVAILATEGLVAVAITCKLWPQVLHAQETAME